MSETSNTKVVQDAYAASGRGDIPALLGALDPKVEWTAVAELRTPTSGTRHGREGVAEFFQQLAASLELQSFEPPEFIAEGDKVVTLGHYVGRSIATGRTFESLLGDGLHRTKRIGDAVHGVRRQRGTERSVRRCLVTIRNRGAI